MTIRDARGRPHNITRNSCASLSLKPPLVLWSIRREARAAAIYAAARAFAVNVLAADQQTLSMRFSAPVGDRFAGIVYERRLNGVPLLAGCVTWIECQVHDRRPAGDHIILIGEVHRVRSSDRLPFICRRIFGRDTLALGREFSVNASGMMFWGERQTDDWKAGSTGGKMPSQLICISHGLLMQMLISVEEPQVDLRARFFHELKACSATLVEFNPDLVVIFGPGYFDELFYELMQILCAGTFAQIFRDGHLGSDPLRVPRQLALDCAQYPHRQDFDAAISRQMRVGHGINIRPFKLRGSLCCYTVLPIFINCAADPRLSSRRVRNFASAVGEFFSDKDLRNTFIGSGEFSHDPSTPKLEFSPPDLAQGSPKRQKSLAGRAGCSRRGLSARRALCLWGRALVCRWKSNGITTFLRRSIFAWRIARRWSSRRSVGRHLRRTQVCTWSRRRPQRALGNLQIELRYYHLVPEFGLVVVGAA